LVQKGRLVAFDSGPGQRPQRAPPFGAALALIDVAFGDDGRGH
jgi:hypothetical protein